MSGIIASAGPLPSLPVTLMQYSAEGAKIAADTYTRASCEPQATGANSVLWDGYNRIVKSPLTTGDEKAIAGFGDSVSHITLDSQEHNRVAFSVMGSIAHPINGPVGRVLGSIIYKAAQDVKLAKTANNTLWKGYDAILQNPKTTDVEKAVASIGQAVSYNTLEETEHNRIAYPLMQAISGTLAGAAGPAIAQAAYAAAGNTKYAKSANQVLWSAFTVIGNNAHTIQEEKAIAHLGDRISHSTLEETEHNRAAFPLLRALAEGVKGPVGTLLAQIAYDAGNNVKYAETANHIFWSACGEILQQSGIDEAQRAVAQLGAAISRHSMIHTEHNRVNYPLFKIMCAPIKGGIPKALAYAATAAANNTSDSKTSAIALSEGFKAILARVDATGMQKYFAQKGIDIDGKINISATDANTLRLMLMDFIEKSPDSSEQQGPSSLLNPVKLKEKVRGIEEKIDAARKEVKTLEKENADDQPPLTKAIDTHNRRVDKYNKMLRINRYLWYGAIAGGLAGLALHQPLLYIPLGIAGLSKLYVNRLQQCLTSTHTAYREIERRIEQRTAMVEMHHGKIDFYGMELDILKPQLEVLEIADAVNNTGEESDIVNDDENSFVIIGGLKIDKNGEKQDKTLIGTEHSSKSEEASSNSG